MARRVVNIEIRPDGNYDVYDSALTHRTDVNGQYVPYQLPASCGTTMVYLPLKGKKFHNSATCQKEQVKDRVTKVEAYRRGYHRCSFCG
jgi:hypothetical protein